jgi:hypothetical protein
MPISKWLFDGDNPNPNPAICRPYRPIQTSPEDQPNIYKIQSWLQENSTDPMERIFYRSFLHD